MITREEMENYLLKGGYHKVDTPYKSPLTVLASMTTYQYKETDIFFDVLPQAAYRYERDHHLQAQVYKYKDCAIDPSCGCLVCQEKQ